MSYLVDERDVENCISNIVCHNLLTRRMIIRRRQESNVGALYQSVLLIQNQSLFNFIYWRLETKYTFYIAK